MKALPKKLLPLTLLGIAVTSLFFVQPAQAYSVTLQEIGPDVVAIGSGSINLTGLSFFGSDPIAGPLIQPKSGFILTGLNMSFPLYMYRGFTGPRQFGPGSRTFASSGSGDFVGIGGILLFVPLGYVSGTALSDSSIYNSATFASLGVTPGTYVWSWGTGLPNQNFTLIIGSGVPLPVPDGGSTVSLLGCALLGLAALRRKLNR